MRAGRGSWRRRRRRARPGSAAPRWQPPPRPAAPPAWPCGGWEWQGVALGGPAGVQPRVHAPCCAVSVVLRMWRGRGGWRGGPGVGGGGCGNKRCLLPAAPHAHTLNTTIPIHTGHTRDTTGGRGNQHQGAPPLLPSFLSNTHHLPLRNPFRTQGHSTTTTPHHTPTHTHWYCPPTLTGTAPRRVR